MPGANSKPGLPSGPRPKVIFDNEKAADVNAQANTPAASQSNRPKVMFEEGQVANQKRPSGPKKIAEGNPRTRIPVTEQALSAINPQASRDVLKIAKRVVDSTNIDDDSFEDAMQVGAKLQARHSEITEGELAVANDPSLKDGQALVLQMLQTLDLLDPNIVFEKGEGLVGTIVKATKAKPSQVFDKNYPILEKAAISLKNSGPKLIEQLEKLRSYKIRYEVLVNEITGYILGAQYIQKYVEEKLPRDNVYIHYQMQAETLAVRAESLLTTQATLAVGRINNESLQIVIQQLIDAGRDMLEIDLPAFRTAYTSALTNTLVKKSTESDLLKPLIVIFSMMRTKLKPTEGDTPQ